MQLTWRDNEGALHVITTSELELIEAGLEGRDCFVTIGLALRESHGYHAGQCMALLKRILRMHIETNTQHAERARELLAPFGITEEMR
jgi:hypothetical protein